MGDVIVVTQCIMECEPANKQDWCCTNWGNNFHARVSIGTPKAYHRVKKTMCVYKKSNRCVSNLADRVQRDVSNLADRVQQDVSKWMS